MVKRVAPARRIAAVRVAPKPQVDPRVRETRTFLREKLVKIKEQRETLFATKARKVEAGHRKDARQITLSLNRLAEEQRQATRLLDVSKKFIIPVGEARQFISQAGRAREKGLMREAFVKRQRTRIEAGEFERVTPKIRQRVGIREVRPVAAVTVTEKPPVQLAPMTRAGFIGDVREVAATRREDIDRVTDEIIGKTRSQLSKQFARTPAGLFTFAGRVSPRIRKQQVRTEALREAGIRGFIPKNLREVKETAIIGGIGAGIGAAAVGITATTAKFAPKAAPLVSQIGGIGLAGVGGVALKRDIEKAAGIGITPKLPLYKTKIERIEKKDIAQITEGLGATARRTAAAVGGFAVGARGAEFGIGLVRTRGMRFIPREKIGAEEAGVVTIPRGATVRSELKAFKDPIKELGEVGKVPRGAQARPLEVEPTITRGKVRKGELIGAFFGTKFNLRFLRMGQQPGLDFGLPGGLPTLVRATFGKGIDPIPGLRPSARLPASTRLNLAKFSEKVTGTGRAFLPGIKSEREVVAIFGAKQFEVGRAFFTKTGGVRVPIVKTVITGTGRGAADARGLPSFRSTFGAISTPTSPGTILTSLGVTRFAPPTRVTTTTTIPPSIISAPTITHPPSKPPSRPPSRPPSKIPQPSITTTTITTPPTTIIPPTIITPPTTITSITRPPSTISVAGISGALGAGLPPPRKKKKKKPKRKFRRTPSFAAAVLGITAAKPRKGEFTGLIERPIIKL